MDLCAVVPVKELDRAKERLALVLPPERRRALMLAMLEDVLTALAAASGLGRLAVVTVDVEARRLATRYGARILELGARDGHTGAVTAMARILAAEGHDMLTVPGDIPRVTAAEIAAVVEARKPAPSLTIVPARDELGSNAMLCSPPLVMPFRFGDNSYFPHLATARSLGIEPTIVQLPGIGLDIDQPEDVEAFLSASPHMATRAYLSLRGA